MTDVPPFGPIPPAPPPPPKQSIVRLLSMWLAGVLQGRRNRHRSQVPPPVHPGTPPYAQQGHYGQQQPYQQQYPHQQHPHQQHSHQESGKKRKKKGDGGDGCDPSCDGCDGCGVPCFDVMFVLVPLLRLVSPGVSRPRRAPTAPARAGLAAIGMYRRRISRHLPTRCRYTPSCSEYGAQAVRRYGLAAGSRLIAERIARCTAEVPNSTPDPLR